MLNLLIVDDEEIVRRGLKQYIDWQKLGYQVINDVECGEKALKIIKIQKVDIVLTDIKMPGMDGLELIDNINKINPYIKTVILSGYEEFEYAKKAIRLGALDFLTKPVNFDEVDRIFTEARELIESEKKFHKYIADSTKIVREEKEDESGAIIRNAKKYIEEHISEEITLNKLSETLYVHPVYLSKLFKEKSGQNFLDYVQDMRIDKAKWLLEDLSLKIYDVSYMVGYESPKYFSKIFKEKVGMTPKEYRDNMV